MRAGEWRELVVDIRRASPAQAEAGRATTKLSWGTPAASFLFANNSTRLSLAEARANPYQPIGIERRPTPNRSFFDDPVALGWELSLGARELAA